MALTVEPLRGDQYRQVAEWEFGPQPENTDWDKYTADMNAPRWTHFGIYSDSSFVGALSLEQQGRTGTEFHIVTGRRMVHPNALANLLLSTAAYLFNQGFTSLTARIPKDKRAAARLAIRCGMREWGNTPTMRFFILTESRYRKYGGIEGKTHSNAI